jgi:hypothetical protein
MLALLNPDGRGSTRGTPKITTSPRRYQVGTGAARLFDFSPAAVLSFCRTSGEGKKVFGGSAAIRRRIALSGKEEAMNWKRFFTASAVIFVVVQAMEVLINGVFMKAAYDSLSSLWRPDMMSKMWVMYVIGVLTSLLFTYIFIKGREGKGISEGVRFGIVIWLFVSVPMNHSMWVLLPIPYLMIFRWTLFSLLELLIAGILAATIYKPLASAPAR